MNTYRKKNYRGKRGYSGRPHRRTADSYHQPLPPTQERIPGFRHTLTKPDVEAVVDALLSGQLINGRELERFESLLAKLTHSEYAIAFSSGTSAVHTALACLKLEPGDEVITSTLGFGHVATMTKLVGATPVLVDCDPNTLTLSVEGTRAAINENTKAIFTNNFGGHPSDLNEFRAICDEHNLVLLEDAGQGLGGKYRGHYVGNQADISCFSFHPSMAITTCEGGAVTTANRAIAEWLRQFRNHGVQKDSRFFQSGESFPDYYGEIQLAGMNYHLSEIHAAIGRSQLTRLDRHIERRRSIAQVYYQKLGSIEELILPHVADWADNAFHFYPIQFTDGLLGKRDVIYGELKSSGIDVQMHYVPLHRMPVFSRDYPDLGRFPNAETYYSRALSLPLFPDLSYKDLERITDLLTKIIAKHLDGPGGQEGGGESSSRDGGGRKSEESDRTSFDKEVAASSGRDDRAAASEASEGEFLNSASPEPESGAGSSASHEEESSATGSIEVLPAPAKPKRNPRRRRSGDSRSGRGKVKPDAENSDAENVAADGSVREPSSQREPSASEEGTGAVSPSLSPIEGEGSAPPILQDEAKKTPRKRAGRTGSRLRKVPKAAAGTEEAGTAEAEPKKAPVKRRTTRKSAAEKAEGSSERKTKTPRTKKTVNSKDGGDGEKSAPVRKPRARRSSKKVNETKTEEKES